MWNDYEGPEPEPKQYGPEWDEEADKENRVNEGDKLPVPVGLIGEEVVIKIRQLATRSSQKKK